MTKHCFLHLPFAKSARLCIVIVGLCASFPAVTDAAKPGGGTCTTMVLSNAYAPPRWIPRCDPPAGSGADLKLTKFQLTLSFDSSRMEFVTPNGATPKVPFIFPMPPSAAGGVVRVQGLTNNPIALKDVDIFELAFDPCSVCSPRPAGPAPLSENFDSRRRAGVAAGLDVRELRSRHTVVYFDHGSEQCA